MKYLIILLICSCVGCKATETLKTEKKSITFKDDLNQSIINGFYNNDTTGKSKNIYFLR